jgi:hypothetical protein
LQENSVEVPGPATDVLLESIALVDADHDVDAPLASGSTSERSSSSSERLDSRLPRGADPREDGIELRAAIPWRFP